MLLSLLQTHRQWSGPELADRLGVDVRTVRRDIDRLRSLGYPVLARSGVDGGYELDRGSQLPPLLVDEDEAVALSLGMRSAAGAAITGIEETSVRMMAKLDRILPDHVRRRVEAVQSSLDTLRSPPTATVPPAHLSVLAQACRDREEVTFDYTRRDGDQRPRRVQPHQMVTVGPRWYLVAWDPRRDDWRTYRLDRMGDVRLIGGRFAARPIPAPSAAEFVRRGLGSVGAHHEATVRLSGAAADLDRAERWLGAQAHRPTGDPTRMTLRADSQEWLAGLIAMLSVSFELMVEEAGDEVRRLLAAAAERLAGAESGRGPGVAPGADLPQPAGGREGHDEEPDGDGQA